MPTKISYLPFSEHFNALTYSALFNFVSELKRGSRGTLGDFLELRRILAEAENEKLERLVNWELETQADNDSKAAMPGRPDLSAVQPGGAVCVAYWSPHWWENRPLLAQIDVEKVDGSKIYGSFEKSSDGVRQVTISPEHVIAVGSLSDAGFRPSPRV